MFTLEAGKLDAFGFSSRTAVIMYMGTRTGYKILLYSGGMNLLNTPYSMRDAALKPTITPVYAPTQANSRPPHPPRQTTPQSRIPHLRSRRAGMTSPRDVCLTAEIEIVFAAESDALAIERLAVQQQMESVSWQPGGAASARETQHASGLLDWK